MSDATHYATAPEDRIPFHLKVVYGFGAFVNNTLADAIGRMVIVLNLGLGMSPALVGLLGALQARGMRSGDELVIFSKSNESFVVAFWAAILGGIVPVPVAVGISDEHRLKLFRILRQLDRATLFTESELLKRLRDFSVQQQLGQITVILDAKTALISDVKTGENGQLSSVMPDELAFIQYSSGSTSDPKGVCLTHRNLCANIRAIIEATHWMEDDQSLSWMPLTPRPPLF